MRNHWANCITNFDADVAAFIAEYFADTSRRVLLVAAAGFDPRSARIARMLAGTLGDRLSAYFVREERPGASEELIARADANEAVLADIVPDCRIFRIEVFADDSAPVGGTRIAAILSDNPIPAGVTDVILDLRGYASRAKCQASQSGDEARH